VLVEVLCVWCWYDATVSRGRAWRRQVMWVCDAALAIEPETLVRLVVCMWKLGMLERKYHAIVGGMSTRASGTP
jgi:hypothetical protein